MFYSPEFALRAASNFARLTTFQRHGVPVPTTVGVLRDTSHLLMLTNATTGKVKRLRHTPRVLITPANARGRMRHQLDDVEATAEIVDDPAEVEQLTALLKARY